MKSRNKLRLHRKRRIRSKVIGTLETPRLCVFRSQCFLYAQLINDEKGNTVYAIDSGKIGKKYFDVKTTEKMGEEVGKAIREKKIEKVVFDRGGYKYHGKIKAFAEGVRKAGIKF